MKFTRQNSISHASKQEYRKQHIHTHNGKSKKPESTIYELLKQLENPD